MQAIDVQCGKNLSGAVFVPRPKDEAGHLVKMPANLIDKVRAEKTRRNLFGLKKIFAVILTFLLAAVSFAQQSSAGCQNRLDFLNDENDSLALSFSGRAKEIKVLERYVESEAPEIAKTFRFDEKGKISEAFLTTAKIKIFGRTVYTYDAGNRLVKKITYNPDGSAVLEDVFGYSSNGALESKIVRNAVKKNVISKTEYNHESTEIYRQYYDGKFARRVKLKKDERCRIVEANSYGEDNELEDRETTKYDKRAM